MSSNLKARVKAMEEKLLKNNCEECDCLNGCKNRELNDAIEEKLRVLKGNKTVLK